MEESVKDFYKMLDSAQKPLHERTMISQLDAIGRIMGLKAELNLSQEGFDKMLAVFGTMLPESTLCRRTCTRQRNSFVCLRCCMTRYMFVRRGASYLGKNTRMQIIVRSVNPPGTWR
jgi:hypothetical protein